MMRLNLGSLTRIHVTTLLQRQVEAIPANTEITLPSGIIRLHTSKDMIKAREIRKSGASNGTRMVWITGGGSEVNST